MRLLRNVLRYACLWCAFFICIFFLMFRFKRAEFSEDMISSEESLFRNNAFLGFDDKELENFLGPPLQCDIMENVQEEDFFWWPSFFCDDTPWPRIKPGQTVRCLIFSDRDDREALVYVCQSLDSNGVWRVIGDVTPPKNIVF